MQEEIAYLRCRLINYEGILIEEHEKKKVSKQKMKIKTSHVNKMVKKSQGTIYQFFQQHTLDMRWLKAH